VDANKIPAHLRHLSGTQRAKAAEILAIYRSWISEPSPEGHQLLTPLRSRLWPYKVRCRFVDDPM